MENDFEKKIEDKERKKKSNKNTKLRSLTQLFFSLIEILCCENQDESPLEQELIWKLSSIGFEAWCAHWTDCRRFKADGFFPVLNLFVK